MKKYLYIGLFLISIFLVSCTIDTESNVVLEQECLSAGESDLRGGVPTNEDIKSLTPCCEGLSKIKNYDMEIEDECVLYVGTFGYICSPCGNGICEPGYGENSCNCPEDCA